MSAPILTSGSEPARRIVVFGGSGFLGQRISRRLIEDGYRVEVLSRSTPANLAAGVAHIQMDAADILQRPEILAGAHGVVYAVAGLLPADSNRNPLQDPINSLIPLIAVLETLRLAAEPPVLVFLSSGGTVYGKPRSVPISEDHPTAPITSYGIMKLAAEKYIGMYGELYGVQARILRISNAYGPGQPVGRGQGVIGEFVHAHVRGKPVTIFGAGTSVRDYIYVDDVAAAVESALSSLSPQIMNVGSGHGLSLLQVLSQLEEVSGQRVELQMQPNRGFDIETVILETSQFQAIRRDPLVPFDLGLSRTWRAALKDRDRL